MKNRKGWFLASLALFTLVVGSTVLLEDTAEIEQVGVEHYLPPVSIVTVRSQNYSGEMRLNAEVKPLWAMTIRSMVSGECVKITEKAFAGQRVKKGELLAKIEDSVYLALVHEAEQSLSEAKLNLLLEQKKATQAERDWKRSGVSTSPSRLALNKPQLEFAKKTVNAATSRLNAARRNHANTRIRAPFSGQITARQVNPGQAISEGEALFDLIHYSRLEITVSLTPAKWSLLDDDWVDQTATVFNSSGQKSGEAKIKRGGGFLDPETRQHKLFLEVNGELHPGILPGDFVRVRLPGRTIHNTLVVPESALTRDSTIWYVDDEDHLRRFFANVLFIENDQIIIKTPSENLANKLNPSTWRIATTPLASFLPGERVQAVSTEGT